MTSQCFYDTEVGHKSQIMNSVNFSTVVIINTKYTILTKVSRMIVLQIIANVKPFYPLIKKGRFIHAYPMYHKSHILNIQFAAFQMGSVAQKPSFLVWDQVKCQFKVHTSLLS